MKEISNIVKLWDKIKTGDIPAALVTLVRVCGSHYRQPGARMLFIQDGETAGSISGGCLETDLREHVLNAIQTGAHIVVQYDTTSKNDLVLGTGMGCGGLVDILIEPIQNDSVRDFLNILTACHESNQSLAVATVWRVQGDVKTEPGQRMTLRSDGSSSTDFTDNTIVKIITDDLRNTLDSKINSSKIVNLPDGEIELFLESVSPPVSLVVFGAGDDSIPLFRLAKQLGWQVSIVDPRKDLLTADRFPYAEAMDAFHAHEIGKLNLESFDAAVIMTHNYIQDLELLKQLLPAKMRYIGLLGAVTRTDKLLAELREQGINIDRSHLDKFYSPVGLDIGAEGKDEIALSIITEIKAVLSKRGGRSLREAVRRANE